MEKQNIECTFCKKSFRKSHISDHKKICESNPNKSGYKTKPCEVCKKPIVQNHYSRHLKACRKPVLNNIETQNSTSTSPPSDLNQPSTSGTQNLKRPHSPTSKKSSLGYKVKCSHCEKYIRKSNMAYHLKTHNETQPLTNRGEIVESIEATPAKQPRLENKSFKDYLHAALFLAMNTAANLVKKPCVGASLPAPNASEITLIRSAFKGRLNVYNITNNHNVKDILTFLNRLKPIVVDKIENHVKKSEIKIRLVLYADFIRGAQIEEFNFKTTYLPVVSTTDISGYYDNAVEKLLREMEEMQAKGSGWSLHKIDELEIYITLYKPLRGSSYIPLPKEIAKKRAIINVKNNDQKCFLWAILSAMHPIDWRNHTRVSSYRQYEHEFDAALKDIKFPVSLKDIPKFEKRSGISINVFACELNKTIKDQVPFEDYPRKLAKKKTKNEYTVYPLHVANEENPERHVNLLYLKDKHNNTHYCWIKNMSRLLSTQISKHKSKILICDRCLQSFYKKRLFEEHKEICNEPRQPANEDVETFICNRCLTELKSQSLLDKHKEYCNEHEAVKIKMPKVIKTKEGEEIAPTIRFQNKYRKMKVPYVGYGDFECILKPIHTCNPSDNNSYTKKYQFHEAASFSLYITKAEDDYDTPFDLYYEHLGSDTAKVFMDTITNVSKSLAKMYSKEAAKPMVLTEDDKQVIKISTVCHICERPFTEKDPRVLDHDHISGKFRNVAHNSCNLNFQKPHFIPVFIHNLSHYDAHLFITMLGVDMKNVAVLATTEETYIAFEIKIKDGVNVRFLDSFRFMPSSLDSLVKNLGKDKFKHMSKYFSSDELDFVLKKGIYPYDYMDDIEKLNETLLPPQEAFYNLLNKTDITHEDYEHAQNVWNKFNIKNMGEYTTLYNKTDTLLLADVVENFRDVCLNTYKLDPAWYFTSPGLAWDAMLKKTDVILDKLTDPDMELMITQGIRGGISQCCNRYSKANNKYLHDYDPKKPNEYLIYLDVNNLYGDAMSNYLPRSEFAWCKENELLRLEDRLRRGEYISSESKRGYIFEVDLEYPTELHNKHKDFPLAPENKTPPGSNQKKLLTTLWHKEKYVLHYRNLQLYLSLGMVLKKIHRGIKFSQSPWLKQYIDLNTDMRTRATNDFEKDYFKLMNNSVFGRTMMNIRKRVKIQLATRDGQIEKLVSRPNFKAVTIFSERLAAVHMRKDVVYLNQPIYVGMSILDLSKITMYEFYYNVLKPKYGSNIIINYKDTDSIMATVKTGDIYEDIKTMIDYFDTSDYKENNPYDMPRVNKKVIGKWKDELSGDVMREFVGLRSKMYAYSSEGNKIGKKAKGIKKSVVSKEITLEDYKTCLFNKNEMFRKMNTIRSKFHNLHSIEQCKKALSPSDDKRYVLEDGIQTLPWGHCEIPLQQIIIREMNANMDLD